MRSQLCLAIDGFLYAQFGFHGVTPPGHLNPFARLQVFVMFKEMLDLLQRDVWEIGILPNADIALRQPVRWHRDDLLVAAAFVGHLQNANRTNIDDGAWKDWPRIRDQHVDRITVVG